MLLKSILYNLSTRFYVEVVDLRIYVFYVVKLLSAFLVENQLHLFLILDISRIDDRRLQSQAADFFRIFDGRVPFAVVHAAGDQDQVGIDFLDLCQIGSAQLSGGNVVDDASCAESRLLCRLSRHIVDQTVDRHLQSSGG